MEIFTVGAGAPKGVPRPVVKRIMWAPAAVRSVAETRSLPGPESRLRPFLVTGSAYSSTSTTGALPPFCTQPQLLSSRVVMPPALLPGLGFS